MSKVLLSLVVVFVAVFYHLHNRLSIGRTIYNHQPGKCREVHGVVDGSEGIELIPSKGIAFGTTGVLPEGRTGIGAIYLYDFAQSVASRKLEAIKLPIVVRKQPFDEKTFRPHGITHWIVNGVVRLYVICHTPTFAHSIEVFDFDEKKRALHHIRSIRNDAIIRPNDLTAVGVDQLVFSNDGYWQNDVLNILEHVLSLNAGSLYYFDGKAFHALIPSGPSPNGLAYDAKRDVLYNAMVLNNSVNAYKLDKEAGSVKLLSAIPVHSTCDNLQVAEDGSVWTACHPKLLDFVPMITHCRDRTVWSPSNVLRLVFDDTQSSATVTEIYANDGSEMSGSSQAIVYKNQLLIGSICRNLVHCEVANLS